MSDYIKREDALMLCKPLSNYEDALKEIIELIPSADVVERKDFEYYRDQCKSYERTIVALTKGIAEDAERKRGKWQITSAYPHNVHCSECHKRFAQTHWEVWEDGSLPRNFCPNCGADMRGVE